jgi:lipoate-protein ligase A
MPLDQERERKLLVLTSSTLDPKTNFALEDRIQRGVHDRLLPNTVRFWVNRECLARGPHRTAKYGWYDEKLANEAGIPICERTTGGGVVYNDQGNLNWSFHIATAGTFMGATRIFQWAAELILPGLERLGFAAYFSRPNRIELDNKKISGMAAKSTLRALLVHGTLLVCSNLDRLNSLCRPPPECPPVCNLSDYGDVTVKQVIATTIETLQSCGFQLVHACEFPA